MGAVDIIQSVMTARSATEAYADLCAEATSVYGTDPYSGTIATTEGVIVVSNTSIPLAAANRIAKERIENLGKGEPCEALPILATADCTKHTITMPITVPGNVLTDFGSLRAALQDAAQRRCSTNEWVDQVNVVAEPNDHSRYAGWKTTTRTVVTTGEGTTELRYYLRDSFNRTTGEPKGYSTQAAARAAAVLIATTSDSHHAITVTAVKVKSSGDPLITVKRVITKAAATLSITIGKNDPNAKRGGWLFYGVGAE